MSFKFIIIFNTLPYFECLKWLLPNPMGGRGQPRYIKQHFQQYDVDVTTEEYSDANNAIEHKNTANDVDPINGSSELDGSCKDGGVKTENS